MIIHVNVRIELLLRQIFFRGYPGCIFSRKHNFNRKIFQVADILLEYIPAERDNVAQAIGMNNDSVNIIATFLENVEQFACRRAVEISHQFQVQIILISMNKNFEIGCHRQFSFFIGKFFWVND
jgi:hypothetical protein